MIVGWSESDKRRGFRSLLLARRRRRKLTYAGKVGTGFNAKLIEELMERMEPLAIDKAAVEVPRADRKGAHWIEPKLVAEITFRRVHRRRNPAPPKLHRAARGQAGEGRGARKCRSI